MSRVAFELKVVERTASSLSRSPSCDLIVFTRSMSFWNCVSACSFLVSASSNFSCNASMSAVCLNCISSNDFRMSATSARKESRSRTSASNRSLGSVPSEAGSYCLLGVGIASPAAVDLLLLTDRSGRLSPIVSGSTPLDSCSSSSMGASLASWGSFWEGSQQQVRCQSGVVRHIHSCHHDLAHLGAR